MKQKCSETYYAVRIGMPGKHILYFMVREGNTLPELFWSRKLAQTAAAKIKGHGKAVKVELRELQ